MDDELLSVPEVAKRLRISPQTLYRWIEEGNLPALRIGRQYRVRESALAELEHDAVVGSDGGQWSGEPLSGPELEE